MSKEENYLLPIGEQRSLCEILENAKKPVNFQLVTTKRSFANLFRPQTYDPVYRLRDRPLLAASVHSPLAAYLRGLHQTSR